MFLLGEVLNVKLEGIDAWRVNHQKRLPVVLTTGEVAQLMKAVRGDAGLVCELLCGCGLRVAAALALLLSLRWLVGLTRAGRPRSPFS